MTTLVVPRSSSLSLKVSEPVRVLSEFCFLFNGVHVEAQGLNMSITTAVTLAVAFHNASAGGAPSPQQHTDLKTDKGTCSLYAMCRVASLSLSLFISLLSISVFTLSFLLFKIDQRVCVYLKRKERRTGYNVHVFYFVLCLQPGQNNKPETRESRK